MLDAMLGKKLGMTQVYDDAGNIQPVTVIQLGPCTVMQVKTPDHDGYAALQLGFDDKPRRVANQPERGHAAKVETEPKRCVREIRMEAVGEEMTAGKMLTAAELAGASVVDVQGVTKGKGFAGVVKRYGFRGQPATHGASKVHRRRGSSSSSSRLTKVPKGMRMAGQMGNVRRTVKNLKVVKLDPERNLLLVCGAVPGPANGYLLVRVVKRES